MVKLAYINHNVITKSEFIIAAATRLCSGNTSAVWFSRYICLLIDTLNLIKLLVLFPHCLYLYTCQEITWRIVDLPTDVSNLHSK